MAVINIKALGLKTAGGTSGDSESDGLVVAENIIINREDQYALRRGLARYGSEFTGKTLDCIGTWSGLLVLRATDGTVYLWDVDGAGSPTALGGSYYDPTDGRLKLYSAALNLFISASGGQFRLDSASGTPEPAGMLSGRDCRATLTTTTGTSIEGDGQTAYRFIFGKRDANDRLILGAPSGRGVVTSAAAVIAAGALVRTGGALVTVTWPSHGITSGEWVVLVDGEANFAAGTYQVTGVIDPNNFAYTNAGANVASASSHVMQRTTRNVSITASVPPNLPENSFFQVYRSLETVSYDVTPSDEMYLVYEGSVPPASRISTLSRAATTVTAVTEANHGLWAGMEVYLPSGLAGAAGILAAVGYDICSSSPDGVTWTTRTGGGGGIAWSGTAFASADKTEFWRSTNGTTWTNPTNDLGGSDWALAMAHGNSTFVSVGQNTSSKACIVLTDDDNANSFVKIASPPSLYYTESVCFGNQRFSTMGWDSNNYMRASQSSDGVTWSTGSASTRERSWETTGANLLAAPWSGWALSGGISGYTLKPYYETIPKQGMDPVPHYAGAATSPTFTCANGTRYRFTGPATGAAAGSIIIFKGTSQVASYSWQEGGAPGTVTIEWVGDGSSNYNVHVSNDSDGGSQPTPTWTFGNSAYVYALQRTSEQWRVASNGNIFLAILVGGTSVEVWKSVDGANYSRSGTSSLPAGAWYGIFYSKTKDKFIAVGNTLMATSSDGSSWSSVASPPTGAIYGGCDVDGTTVVVVGTNVAYTSTDLVTWTSRSIGSGSWLAVAPNSATSIPAGVYTVTSPASGTTGTNQFQFTSGSGNISTTSAPQDVTLISVGFVDEIPEAQLGASLYTNVSQGGALQQNNMPPDALDVAVYQGHTFYGSPEYAPSMLVTLLKLGGTDGLGNGDIITLPGGSITASNSAESVVYPYTFLIGADIFSTVQSLVRVINRAGFGVYAIQTASAETPIPGQFALISTSPLTDCSFSVSDNKTAWSPASDRTVAPRRLKNRIAYSKRDQPDAVPLTNWYQVGAADAKVLCQVPLKSSMLIFKEDGLWRLVGSSPADFSVYPVDTTISLVAPRSIAVLSDVVFALTTSGVVAVSESGVQVVSKDIADIFESYLSPSMLTLVEEFAFGVSYESERSYTLWLPANQYSTSNEVGYTFFADTGQWTSRTDGATAAVVRREDGRLWCVDGSWLLKERKELDETDYADLQVATNLSITVIDGTLMTLSSNSSLTAGDVLSQGIARCVVREILTGNAVVVDSSSGFTVGSGVNAYRSIPARIRWSPTYHSDAPGTLAHSRQAALEFTSARFVDASMAFSTNYSTVETSVPIDGGDIGLSPGSGKSVIVRALVPRGCQRSTRMTVGLDHAQAWCPFSLDRMSVTYEPGTERTRK